MWLVFILTAFLSTKAWCQDDSVTFMMLGDWGDYLLPGQAQVAYQMNIWAEGHAPDFIASSGDNFYPYGVDSVDDPQWETKWLWVYNHSSIENLPWYVSVGNHDYGEGLFNREWNQVDYSLYKDPRWVLPHLWHTYSFPLGNSGQTVQFFAIDTEALNQQTNNYTHMLSWLQDELSRSTARWKFVYGHRPIYSVGDYGPYQGIEDDLLPILEGNGVHVYFCGHDHNLQNLHHANETRMEFIITGAGGALWYAYNDENAQRLLDERGVVHEFFAMTWGFVGVTVMPDKLTVEFIDNNGNLLYTMNRDWWTY